MKKTKLLSLFLTVLILLTSATSAFAQTVTFENASASDLPAPVESISPDESANPTPSEPTKDDEESPSAKPTEEPSPTQKPTEEPVPTSKPSPKPSPSLSPINPEDAKLTVLSVPEKEGVFLKPLSPDEFKYELYLKKNTKKLNLEFGTINKYDPNYTLYVDKTAYMKDEWLVEYPTLNVEKAKTITLTTRLGEHTFKYTITLRRETEDSAKLTKLSLSGIKLKPEFNKNTKKYTANVPWSDYETSLTVKLAEKYSSYKVTRNGSKVDEKEIPLAVGKNTITVEVTSLLGSVTKYVVEVTRAKPSTSDKNKMSSLEKKLVEQAFRLLPERHPFKLAYEEAHNVKIKTYTATKNGIKVSGVPFEFGGGGNYMGFNSRWWNKTSVSQYPVGGLDCAKYMQWIYKQVGMSVPSISNTLFFSGKEGEKRVINGRSHLVIPSFSEAKIGDIAYNSKLYTYASGHGSHTAMFLGTARKLGIASTIKKYYRNFPVDAYLTIDVGWSDGKYYYNMMKKLGVSGRSSMCGVGVQFFPSVRNSDGSYRYKSPHRSSKPAYSWRDSKSGQTFTVDATLERNGRYFQHKVGSGVKNIMNLSRPIVRYD